MGARFRMTTIFEGLETGDRRYIRQGALTHRALPLTLMAMLQNPEMGGHGLAIIAGRIDTLKRVDATGWTDGATGQPWGAVAGGQVWAWIGEGEFADTDEGVEVEGLVRSRVLRGVSADLAEMVAEEEILSVDEDGWPEEWRMVVTAGMVAAATVCNIPAFRGCEIELIEDEGEEIPADAIAASADTAPWLPSFRSLDPTPGCRTCEAQPDGTEVAAVTASGGPLYPPAAWFAAPAVDGPTALHVTDDGRVFGHLALWGTCHTGRPGVCVTPPRSGTGYALFQVGYVRTAEGDDVAVGHITLGGGHAGLDADAAAAAAHYDDVCTVVADVAAGEDEHGIWVSGALRPDVTDAQLRELRAAPLSGDWRRHGRGLELVAALAVNVPGFPVPRALAASGVPQALVAAGARPVIEATRGAEELVSGGDVAAAVREALGPLLTSVERGDVERRLRRLLAPRG